MRKFLSRVTSPLFALLIICFFMPFVAISCDHKKVVEITGIQLVTGTEVKNGGFLWEEAEQVPPQGLAIIPFGLALVGLLTGMLKGEAFNWLRFGSGLGGAISLFFLKLKLTDEVLHYPKLIFVIDYLPCYWIALGLCVAVLVVNAAILIWKPKTNS